MFKSIFVAIATAALVAAQAGIVSITSPLGGNVYTAGGQAIITWVNPTVDVIPQITLSKGLSTALQPVMQVASNVSAKDMQYTWNIPATVAAGNDYAFVFGISPNLAYTGQFTIKAADGTAPAPASGSSAAPSVVSTPAAGASSSSKPSAAAGSSSAAASGSSSSAAAKPSNGAGQVAPVAVSAMAMVGAAAIALM